MMDTVLKLYFFDGQEDMAFPYGMEQAELHDFTVSRTRMGTAPTISATLEYPTCLDDEWASHCHFDDIFVTFNGEKFYLKSTPTSSKTNDKLFYKHELQFVSERVVLETVYMLDDNENQTANILYSNNTKYTFFGNLAAFVERINQSMYFSDIGDTCMYSNGSLVPVQNRTLNNDGFYVVVDASVTSTEEVLITLSNNMVSDALRQIFEKFGVPYYFVGRVCHIGEYQPAVEATPAYADSNGVVGAGLDNGTLIPYEYGAPNSVLNVTRSNQTKQIYNRCSGIGSGDNIPYYYPNLSPKGDLEVETAVGNAGDAELEIVNQKLFAEKVDIDSYVECASDNPYPANVSSSFYKPTENPNPYEHTTPSGYTSLPAHVPVLNQANGDLDTEFGIYKIRIVFSGYGFFTLRPVLRICEPIDNSVYNEIPNTRITSAVVYRGQNAEDDWLGEGSAIKNGDMLAFSVPDNHDQNYHTLIISYSISQNEFESVAAPVTYGYVTENQIYITLSPNFGSGGLPFFVGNDHDKFYLLSQLGLSMTEGFPEVGDRFYQRLARYIQPQQKLMPRCYRESDGKKRFYPALNYPLSTADTTPDADMGDTVVDTTINNPYYEKANKQYYHFDNPLRRLKQKEHIYDIDEIKPTIKEMTNISVRRIDMFADIAFDDNDDNSYTTDENGNIEYNHPYFFVKLRMTNGYYRFNLFDHAIDEQDMSIAMTSGHCAPCEFTIMVDKNSMKNLVQVDSNGNLLRDADGDVRCGRKNEEVPQDRQNDTENYEVWIALRKDIETYGEIMPFNDGTTRLFPSPCSGGSSDDGDTFVILHIELPEAYVLAAEDRLSKEIVKKMHDDNSENFNKTLKYSRVFLGDNQPLVDILNESVKVSTKYNGITTQCFVSSYSYSVKPTSPIPEITLSGLVESVDSLGGSAKGVFGEINQRIDGISGALEREMAKSAAQMSRMRGQITKGNVVVQDGMPYRRVMLSAGGENVTYLPNGADGKYLKIENGEIVWGD